MLTVALSPVRLPDGAGNGQQPGQSREISRVRL
jgi:hypothetical protein